LNWLLASAIAAFGGIALTIVLARVATCTTPEQALQTWTRTLFALAVLLSVVGVSVIGVAMPVDEGARQEFAETSLSDLERVQDRTKLAEANISALISQRDTVGPQAQRNIDRQIAQLEIELDQRRVDERAADRAYEVAAQISRDSNDWLIAAASIAVLIALGILAALWKGLSANLISGLLLMLLTLLVGAAPWIDANPPVTGMVHRLALVGLGIGYVSGLKRIFVNPRSLVGPNAISSTPAIDLAKLAAIFVAMAAFVGFANLIAASIGVSDGWVNTVAAVPGVVLALIVVVIPGVPVARLVIKLSRWNFGNYIAPWMLRLANRFPRTATLWLFASPWSILVGIITPLGLLYRNTPDAQAVAPRWSDAFDTAQSVETGLLGVAPPVVLWLLSFPFNAIHRQALRWWVALWQPKVTHETRWSRLVEQMAVPERRSSQWLRLLVANSVAGDAQAADQNRWWIGLMNPTLEALAVRSDRPLLIVGPTGSGKTTSMVLQNAILHNGPMVITSTKDELMLQLAGGFHNEGRPCYVFDPLATVQYVPPGINRVSWNPLGGCSDWERARKRATLMVGAASSSNTSGGANNSNDFWDATAADTLAALLFGCAVTNRTLRDLLDIVSTLGVTDENHVTAFGHLGDDLNDMLLDDPEHPESDELLMCLSSLEQVESITISGGTTASSLQLSVARALAALRSVTALRLLMNHEYALNVHDVIAHGGVVFLVSETEDQKLTAPLFVGLIDEIVHSTYQANRRGVQPVETLLLLDELAQLAPLKNLPALIAEGRGKGLRILAVLQDLAQAEAVWGHEGRAFTSKFPYLVILPGLRDKEILESLELIAGRYDHRYTTSSYTKQGTLGFAGLAGSGSLSRSKTVTQNQERRSLLEAGAIAAMAPGQALFFANAVGLDRGWSEVWLTPTYTNEPFRQPFGDYLNQPVQPAIDLTEPTPAPQLR